MSLPGRQPGALGNKDQGQSRKLVSGRGEIQETREHPRELHTERKSPRPSSPHPPAPRPHRGQESTGSEPNAEKTEEEDSKC